MVDLIINKGIDFSVFKLLMKMNDILSLFLFNLNFKLKNNMITFFKKLKGISFNGNFIFFSNKGNRSHSGYLKFFFYQDTYMH